MPSDAAEIARRFADFDWLPAGTLDGAVGDALQDRRVVVAGVSGFVGGWLLAALAWLNVRVRRQIGVTGVSRSAARFGAPWYRHVTADLRRRSALPRADVVIHAAMSSEAMPAGGDVGIRETARAGTTWALQAAAAGARTLVLSSGAVDSSTDAYAEAKREMEAAALAAVTRGQAVFIARLYTCLGPGYRAHSHLAHVALFDAARAGGPLRLAGDGSAVRSYLYGADVASWLLRAAVLARPGDVFAVGSPEPVTTLELARAVATAAGLRPDAVHTGTVAARRPRYVPVLGEPHVRMGLAPWTPLHRAVQRTLALWPAGGSA